MTILPKQKYMQSSSNKMKSGHLTLLDTSLQRTFSPWIPSAITFSWILLLSAYTQTAKDVLHSYSFVTVCPWPRPTGMNRSSKQPTQTLHFFCDLNLRWNEYFFPWVITKHSMFSNLYDVQQNMTYSTEIIIKSSLKIYSLLHVVKMPCTFIISPTRKLFSRYAFNESGDGFNT